MPMKTDVKFYSSDMFGAPTLNDAAGKAIEVLDACLINGFDTRTVDSLSVTTNVATATISAGHQYQKFCVIEISGATPAELNGQHRITAITATTLQFKTSGISDQTATGTISIKISPAGWTKPFSDTNLAVYKSTKIGSSNCYYKVFDTTTRVFKMRSYEAMTGISVGTNEMVPPHEAFFKSEDDSPNKPWSVIATDNFVYWVVKPSGTTTITGYSNAVGCFGDIISRKQNDLFRGIIRGNHPSGYTTPSSSSYSPGLVSNAPYASIQRSYTGLGSSVPIGTFALGTSSTYTSGDNTSFTFPNGPDFSLLLFEVFVNEITDASYRGKFPGLLVSPQPLAGKLGSNPKPTFEENILDIGPDNLLIKVPFEKGSQWSQPAYFFLNATQWV